MSILCHRAVNLCDLYVLFSQQPEHISLVRQNQKDVLEFE